MGGWIEKYIRTERERERERGGVREEDQVLDTIPKRIVLWAFITVSRGHVWTLMMGDCCITSV
jgi:hypothetical protein